MDGAWPMSVCALRPIHLTDRFDFARPLSLGEERFERAIEAEDCEPTLGRIGCIQLPRLTPAGWVGPR